MRPIPSALAIVLVLVLYTGLAALPHLDWREARDAQVARELVQRREPLTPLLGGEPHFEKPVLAYLPEVLLLLDGDGTPGPFRSRVARATVAFALVVLVASVGAGQFGARAGWLAALVLCTTLGLPLAARTDGTQLLATLSGWVACWGFADATFGRPGGRSARLLVAWTGVAGALVLGGPLPALWPLGAVALYALLVRDRRVLAAVHPRAGVVFAAGASLPWYGAMLERHGAAFAAAMPFFPYAVEHRGPWWTGVALGPAFLVVGAFPWIALLPPAMAHAATWWRPARRGAAAAGAAATGRAAAPPADPAARHADPVTRERREEHAAHFFIAALLAALVPVAFYPGPPLPAALPALPAAALLVGRFLDHLFEDDARLARPLSRASLTLGTAGTVAAVTFTALATRLREAAPALQLLGAVTLVVSWAPFLASFMGRRRLAAALVALPVAVGSPIVALRLMPAMAGYLSAWEAADAMNRVSPPRAPLVLVEPPPPSLRLHAGRNLVVVGDLARDLEALRAEDGYAYVAFRPVREARVAEAAPGGIEILVRTPSLVLARFARAPAS